MDVYEVILDGKSLPTALTRTVGEEKTEYIVEWEILPAEVEHYTRMAVTEDNLAQMQAEYPLSLIHIFAGNWKMNMTPSQAVELINTLKPLVVTDEADVVFCVPAIDIIPAVEAAKGSNIEIGAENMYFEEKGAYTGEIAPDMLTDAGVKYVIIGHSERREYFLSLIHI